MTVTLTKASFYAMRDVIDTLLRMDEDFCTKKEWDALTSKATDAANLVDAEVGQ